MDKELAFFENLTKKSSEGINGSRGKHTDVYTNDITSVTRNLDIFMIGAVPFNTLVQQAGKAKTIEIFSVSMRNIKIALQSKN